MKPPFYLLFSFTVVTLLGVFQQSASAALSLTNWSITSGSLSFDISGTIQVGSSPATNKNILWLADAGNGSWINNDTNPSFTITGTIDGNNASSPGSAFSFTGSGTTNVGMYLQYGGGPPFFTPTNFDFTDATANEVNIHVAFTSAGKYNPANINPADLELYWGGNAFSADTSSAVPLGITTTPEPGRISLLGLGALALLVRRRRPRGK